MPFTPEHSTSEIFSFLDDLGAFPQRISATSLYLPHRDIYIHYLPMLSPGEPLPTLFLNKFTQSAFRCIWEDQWHLKKDIMQSRLASLSGKTQRFHGRHTRAQAIPGQNARDFLDQYHILGGTVAKYKYGLLQRYTQDLLAVMTFSKARPITREGKIFQSYELIRQCNRHHETVVGGLSKLLSAFIREQSPDDIVTYVGLDWSDGKVYEKMGFELESISPGARLKVNPHNGKRLPLNRTPEAGDSWKEVYYPGNRKFIRRFK